MLPTNFEKEIQAKLQNRTIVPKKELWEELDQKLNGASKKRKIGSWIYYAAAASVLIVIALTAVFSSENDKSLLVEQNENMPFIKKSDTNNNPEIKQRTTNSKEEIAEVKEAFIDSNEIKENTKSEDVVGSSSVSNELDKLEAKHLVAVEVDTKAADEQSNQISTTDGEASLADASTLSDTEALNADVVEAFIAEVTDDELNKLLSEAQKQLAKEEQLSDSLTNMLAESLLAEVSEEINRSFKDKLYFYVKTEIKQGFKSFKYVLVRNLDKGRKEYKTN